MSQDESQHQSRDGSHDHRAGQHAAHADATTVEALVRKQLSEALGGRRGMAEAAAPTLLFTGTWLTTKDLSLALMVSIGAAVLLLAIRLVQRSSVQFCVNALVGIGIGWFFINRAAAAGGTVEEQALAYFLPGVLYNAAYAVVLALSCVTRWPLVGFMVGSVTGDPTAWRSDPQVVRLTSALTWVLAAPCVLRVVVQAPIYLAGTSGAMDADAAVATLGLLKIGLGWPLQLGALVWMVWLLGRNHTPLQAPSVKAPGASA